MKENKYIMGLVSVSFRQHTPKEIVKAAKTEGLSCIEWGSDVHAPCNDYERLQEIVALQQEYGIECSSYGTYFRFGVNKPQELADYIKAAKVLGTDILRLWCGTKGSQEYTNQEKDALFADCKTAAEIAEKYGVKLCMECHKGTYTDTIEGAVELMEYVNSPAFRMYWQPFQWQEIEQNLMYAEKIAPYAEHIHVFQWKDKEHFSLKEGIEEWQSYLSKFNNNPKLLLEFMPDNRIESLKTEAEMLRIITEEKK